MKLSEFNSASDIPDLGGKVYVVTGGTAGLGRESVLELVRHGAATVYFTGRNKAAADEILQAAAGIQSKTEVRFVEADFTSLASVKRASEQIAVATSTTGIDGFLGNAGIMAVEPSVSKDGYEIQFAVNHMAHALMMEILLSSLKRRPGARIVALTSLGHKITRAGGISLEDIRTPQNTALWGYGARWFAYGQSKLANILYAKSLAQRHPDLLCVAVHPGVIATGLVNGLNAPNRIFVRLTTIGQVLSTADGVKNQLWALTAPVDNSGTVAPGTGEYYEPVAVGGNASAQAQDAELADKLYDFTQAEIKPFLS